jgi:hypothetical protein
MAGYNSPLFPMVMQAVDMIAREAGAQRRNAEMQQRNDRTHAMELERGRQSHGLRMLELDQRFKNDQKLDQDRFQRGLALDQYGELQSALNDPTLTPGSRQRIAQGMESIARGGQAVAPPKIRQITPPKPQPGNEKVTNYLAIASHAFARLKKEFNDRVTEGSHDATSEAWKRNFENLESELKTAHEEVVQGLPNAAWIYKKKYEAFQNVLNHYRMQGVNSPTQKQKNDSPAEQGPTGARDEEAEALLDTLF